MDHQLAALKRAWPMKEFALFHEMGTGKTFTAINLACARFQHDQIDALVVICPTPIKNVWEDELEKFATVDHSVWVFESGDKPSIWAQKKRPDEMKVFVVGVESLSLVKGNSMRELGYFMRFHRCMVVVDESSRIKNYKATRTKNVVNIGGKADYRMILTGTPVTQGLQDLYGQFLFLNQTIIGCKSYTVFRNRYCVMGGFKGKQILGYQFKDHLLDKIAPYVDYVTKEQCLDLPDKIYLPVIKVKPTVNQMRVMKQLRLEFSMEDGGDEIEVSTVLERMTRYQQVIGGSFPFEGEDGYDTKPIPGGNPKLEAMVEVIKDVPDDKKVIIWARFRPEIGYIVDRLRSDFGDERVVEFHGGVGSDARTENVRRFQNDPDCRFIVSNQAVGGMGQTWTAATIVIYFSNSFSYEDRYQSEDRAHRRGQTDHVVYQDIEMAVPEDEMILRAVRNKRDLAEEVEERLKEKS